MDQDDPLKPECYLLAKAFNDLKEKFNISWNEISVIAKQASLRIKFGKSKTNIQGYFGVGGKSRSMLEKGPYPIVQKVILCIIEEVNKHKKLGIKYKNRRPVITKDGNFILTGKNTGAPKSRVEKDAYRMYYWRNGDTLGQGNLILFKTQNRKATLEILYEDKDNLFLEGEYRFIQNTIVASFHDKQDEANNPLSLMSWIYYSGTIKDCYIGTYSTCHRGVPFAPVAGVMILARNEFIKGLNGRANLENIAHFYLNSQRFKVKNAGVNFAFENDTFIGTENSTIDAYFETVKFAGIYKLFFVNPKKPTLETGILGIDENCNIQWLVDARIYSAPFKGVCRLYSKRKDLILSYDFIKEINDYRMRIILDVDNFHHEKNTWIFGLMSGLELTREELMSSAVAMRKIDDTFKNIMDFKSEIKVIDLSHGQNFDLFEEELKDPKLIDFFFGKSSQNFTSLATLLHLKQSPSQ